MPGVANAVSTRVLLQLFPPRSALCPFFFHLGTSRHVQDPFHTCFGHEMGARAYVTCYKTLDYLACYVPLGICNMGGAKHDNMKKKKPGQRAD